MSGHTFSDEMGLETDRRTLLKASGVAAGAGALGLASRTITAQSGNEHYVVASDIHAGSPYSNANTFYDFLQTEVPALDPDALILAGDIFEFWFRGMSSTLLEHTHISSALEEFHASGTDVTLVAGNHDRRLFTVGAGLGEEAPDAPWQIGNAYEFESGGRQFVANHGDDGDPLQINALSNLLCVTDDNLGSLMTNIYGWWTSDENETQVGETGTASVDTFRYGWNAVATETTYEDPVVVTSPAEANGDAPVYPQVRNLESDGSAAGTDQFGLRLESWDADVGIHSQPPADVQYAVFERGQHVIAGNTNVVVERTTADDEWTSVTFDAGFGSTPVVMANVQTPDTDSRPLWQTTPAIARVRNVSASGFEVRVETPEGEPVTEREVGFVATEEGLTGSLDGLIESVSADASGDSVQSVQFSREFEDTPTVLAGLQTAESDRPAIPEVEHLDTGGVELTLEGEDGTAVSSGESVSYLALGPGTITSKSTTAASTDTAAIREEWQNIVESSDVLPTEEMPDTPPGLPLEEGQVSAQATTTENLLDLFPDRFVVFGHTHVPDLGERHVNSGSWTERTSSINNTFVEIVDGAVTVWDWSPSGKEVLYEE